MIHGGKRGGASFGRKLGRIHGGRKYTRCFRRRCSVSKNTAKNQKNASNNITLNVVSGQFGGAENDGAH